MAHLRSALPTTKVVLLGILPRGWRGPTHFGVRPEKGLWYDWPNPFTPVSNKRSACAILLLISMSLMSGSVMASLATVSLRCESSVEHPGCFDLADLLHRALKKSTRA